ncbi:peroxidase family protein [Crocosphaera sp.]|uniref:peroxidase family protein n=1 Tax=Crocosphaera sp. TaxID=2729996 RepID=UPI003F208A99|nr:peroxidase family protein [Crocosphaera sp.]
MGHGTVGSCAKTAEGQANESPFSRLFLKEEHEYNAHAISLLSGALGPMQEGSPSDAKPGIKAGFTFLGQFIDHDLTEFRVVDESLRIVERNPTIGVRQVVAPEENPTTANGRTGKLDLDSVYGLLGTDNPALFDSDGFFILGSQSRRNGKGPRDIHRNVDFADGRLIADPRNDENKIIVQLHILFMRLHNKIHQGKVGSHPLGSDGFHATKEKVQQAYRRIVVCDYLPRIVKAEVIKNVINSLKNGTSFYQQMNRRVNQAIESEQPVMAMPVEFAHAAFRLGHSQLRDRYLMQPGHSLRLFETFPKADSDLEGDLRGGQGITEESEIDWNLFFGENGNNGLPLDTLLPASVFRLPRPAVSEPPISLAERNILRGVDFGLPSGQEVAVALRSVYGPVPMVPGDQLGIPTDVLEIEPSLEILTPLWYYILREAEVLNPNEPQLGDVGGYIVAETILGSIVASGFDMGRVGELRNQDKCRPINEVDQIDSMVDLLVYLEESDAPCK